jgi:hypothetical protein
MLWRRSKRLSFVLSMVVLDSMAHLIIPTAIGTWRASQGRTHDQTPLRKSYRFRIIRGRRGIASPIPTPAREPFSVIDPDHPYQ